jgi:hypothetical protein
VVAVAAQPDAVVRAVAAGAIAVGAAGIGLAATLLGRSRRAAKANADLWSRATRGVAERDLEPPSTVAVDSNRWRRD